MPEEKDSVVVDADSKSETKTKREGVISRIWKGLFRPGGDDFEKRLQYISKEEANVLKRMNRRSVIVRRRIRQLIFLSLAMEVIAVSYAIFSTRTNELDWKMRTTKILPMFILPALTSLLYSSFVSLAKMWERKDQKILEKLRAERQAKIDELKEKTKYYLTQQLIQRYDPDPAAKAAAATVLASKLGADSGLKVYVGDENEKKSNETDQGNLRNRKQPSSRSGSTQMHLDEQETMQVAAHEDRNNPVIVEHHDPQTALAGEGGWLARLAALLVGEDPAHSYALICGNCHMHNGLAKKEDYPFITYYCPHCHALNQPKNSSQRASGSATPIFRSEGDAHDAVNEVGGVDLPPVAESDGGEVIEPLAKDEIVG